MSDHSVEVGRSSGRINVSPTALRNIASGAVLQCYGVVGIAAKRIRGGRARMLDERNYGDGISIALTGETVTVDVYVVVEYGTRISEVAHNIITSVGSEVRRMLGDMPVQVNVNVQGLRISS